ncbi:ABC transporter permease [Thermoproteus tenax]|uniref:ABC-type antimicrobial peptide transport system, permease component n=1 Tax=Thermoproteus tenax (strain ATCC 35583 / DSM 2078 / JCM 9277 / NBRC 100435 / Kra 1) TaxID=768679 RepID=G4RJH7_THETK|nr:ABC transporter permease [Thermoproteus tenax]CCC81722.1 ABC-type antimicrobial peptide transport system, permease component [Thermoproteus tenax Kra 1]
MWEQLQLAWSALWERRGRTLGAIAGIVIAYIALTFALSVGNAFRISSIRLFQALGTNNVFLVGSFTDADVASVKVYTAPYALAVIPVSGALGSIRLPNGKIEGVNIYGVPAQDVKYLLPPSSLALGTNAVGGGLAIVGYYVAFDRDTGAQLLAPGYPIVLDYGGKSYNLVVSGVLSLEHPGILNTVTSVVLDEAQFKSITGVDTYQIIVVTLRDSSYIERVQSLLKAVYPNAQVITLASLVQTINQFFLGLEVFLGLVPGVSSVITALWLYDTMTISVLQRTKEFGILRAIGFKSRQITALVLYEAIIIALMGIGVGAVLLAPLSLVPISFFPGMPLRVTPPLHIALATASLVLAVNALGALAPAVRAGRLNIVEALRYE